MLVLMRKIHERIYVGNDIVIEVIDSWKGGCRIGIAAPPEVPIRRDDPALADHRLLDRSEGQ